MDEQRKPYVRVTPHGPDDGGDFGPNTAGTKTAGISEAIAYAHEHLLDVYIHGGRGGMHQGKGLPTTYNLQETLHVPWAQDFRLDGSNYTITYGGPGPVIHIDSQMNCKYRFGMVLGSGTSGDPSVLLKPSASGPDDMAVIVGSEFEFAAVCGYDGIVLDATVSGIVCSRIFAEETNSMHYGVYLTDGGTPHSIENLVIDIPYTNQYHATGDTTAFRIGDPGSRNIRHNRFKSMLGAPAGIIYDAESGTFRPADGFVPPEGSIGLDIYGDANVFEMSFNGTRSAGRDVVFAEDARDNLVHAFNLPNGYTNNAKAPTNRIHSYEPVGFRVDTPEFPRSGEALTNRSAYTVEAFIKDAGDVSEWSVVDATGAEEVFSGGLFVGQSFMLEPGDQVRFDYLRKNSHDVPNWRWKAVR